MRAVSSRIPRSLGVGIALLVIWAATGCAAAPPTTFGYLKALEQSHELDTKAVKACTQGYTPKPVLLAARDSTLRALRKIMMGDPELARDSILSSNRQGYAAICIVKTTEYGKPLTAGEYHLTPPSDGVGGADGGGILEW